MTKLTNLNAVVQTLKKTNSAYGESTLLIATLDDGTVIKTFAKPGSDRAVLDGNYSALWTCWSKGDRIFIAEATVKGSETFKGQEYLVLRNVKIDAAYSDKVRDGSADFGTGSRTVFYTDGTSETTLYRMYGNPATVFLENEAEWETRQKYPQLNTSAIAERLLNRDPQARDYDLSSRYPVHIGRDGLLTEAGIAELAKTPQMEETA